MRILCLLLISVLTASAQQPVQPAAQAQQGFTLTVNTELVVEAVTVKDKNGKPIEDLTAKDFVVTEDGVPQTISVFEFQKLQEDAPVAAAAPTPETPAAPLENIRQITPEKPGDIRYRDRRLMVLYFDMSAMPEADQLRALYAARKFVEGQMKSPDLIAILEYTGSAVKVLQDFTPNREILLTAIDTLIIGEAQGLDSNSDDVSDSATAFGQDDSEFNLFTTDRQLSALQTAVNMLKNLNEQKSLVYFASGLRLNGIGNQAQLHATVNAAIRANVAFYPIDARGLVARAPLGDATQGSPSTLATFTGGAARAVSDSFQRSQDTLYALASDTGGKAMLDTNDLSAGIVQAQQAITSYYLVGYYTSNANLDGKFRRIKISLKEIDAKLSYREGYYAGKTFTKYTAADKERQLEDALMLGDPITDLTIAMELNYFRLNQAEYFVPLTVKIPGRELALAKKGGAEHTVIDFIGEVKDNYGTTIQNVRDKVDVKLSGETAAQLAKSPIEYDTGFTLLPGKYVIKFLARDAETGRIGTYQANFVVPNLNKELQRVPISSVVLGSQRVDLRDALYNARKETVQTANPLVDDGQKLIPSVTRVFSKGKDLYVYLQAYQITGDTLQPLVAFVSLYQGQAKAFETSPVPVALPADSKSKTLPLRFSLSLAELPPGEYNCQVTVLDPNGQKAAFWQAPVRLVP